MSEFDIALRIIELENRERENRLMIENMLALLSHNIKKGKLTELKPEKQDKEKNKEYNY